MAKINKIKEDTQKYYAAGKWDKALQGYSAIVKAEPKDPKNYQKIAELQTKIGMKKESVESYKKACEVYMGCGFLIQAIAMCKMVVQIDPSQKDMEKRIAELYSQRGIGSAGAKPAARAPTPPRAPAAASPNLPSQGAKPIPKPRTSTSPTFLPEPLSKLSPTSPVKPALPVDDEEAAPEIAAPAGPKTWTIDVGDLDGIDPEVEVVKPDAAKPSKPVPETKVESALSDLPPLDMGPIDEKSSGPELGDLPPLDEGFGDMAAPSSDSDLPPMDEPLLDSASPEEGGMDIDVMGEDEIPEEAASPEVEIPIEEEIEVDMEAAEPEVEIPIEEELASAPGSAEPKVWDISTEVDQPTGTDKVAGALDEEWDEVEDAPTEPPSGESLLDEVEIEDLNLFPDIPLFKDLGKEEFQQVVKKLSAYCKLKGETLVNEGDEGDSIFIISGGSVSIFKNAPDGKKIQLGTLREGDIFGEFGYFAGSRRQASVVADEDVEVLEMSREDMDKVVAEFPSVEQVLELFYRERVMENILATSMLFRELSLEERKKIASLFKLSEIREGEDVVKEGADGDAMYLIRSGEVAVHTTNPMGEKVHLAELKAGDFFGEISLIQGKPRTATVTASSPVVELMQLSKHDLDDIIGQYPEVLDKLKVVIDARIEQTVNKVSILDLDGDDLEFGSLL